MTDCKISTVKVKVSLSLYMPHGHIGGVEVEVCLFLILALDVSGEPYALALSRRLDGLEPVWRILEKRTLSIPCQ